jgi:hypothetical protein
MDTKNIIESIGYITKEEKLASVKQNIIPDTLVIETVDPFPGYHGKNLPEEVVCPEFMFFVTREKYTTEHILRVTENVQKYFGNKPDVARAELNIYNRVYPAFRIKGCKDFTRLIELQSCYKSEGIKFAKSRKIEANGLIKIQKTFTLQEQGEGIYFDKEDPDYYYIKLPAHLNWEQFKSITLNIKRNTETSNFDAALGLFYRKQGIIDFVRIYDKESKMDKLMDIKERYYNEIKKFLLDKFV